MRYRIQIEDMLDHTLVIVTDIVAYGSTQSIHSKMYVLQDVRVADGLVELLGELQRTIGETQA
jgi:hypothetical protein